MRLVLRVLFFEFALSWAMVLAGWIRVTAQVRPFLVGALRARFRRRAWRAGLGLLVGLAVAAGWPLLFLFLPAWAAAAHGNWLNVALLWWVLAGACGSVVLAAKVSRPSTRRELRTGCQCGTCTAYGRAGNP